MKLSNKLLVGSLIAGILSVGAVAGNINNPELWVKPKNPIAKGSEANKNLQLVVKFFEAYGKGDYEAIKKIVAPDVQWSIPGHHKLAGVKQGVDELLAFFKKLEQAGFKAEPMIFAANDNYVIDAHRGWSTKGKNGKNVDLNWVLLYQIIDGKIKRVQNFSGDTYVSDEFFDNFFKDKK